MGWTYGPLYQFGSMKQFVKEYNYENEKAKSTVLDYAVVNRTILYVAVEQIIKSTQERRVLAAIVEFKFNRKEYGYRDMDESMNPYHHDCPTRILDLLTPTDNPSALKWREACREHSKLLSSCSMKEGQVFVRKLSYSTKVDTVTLIRPITKYSWVGVTDEGAHYRYTKKWLVNRGYLTEEQIFEKQL